LEIYVTQVEIEIQKGYRSKTQPLLYLGKWSALLVSLLKDKAMLKVFKTGEKRRGHYQHLQKEQFLINLQK